LVEEGSALVEEALLVEDVELLSVEAAVSALAVFVAACVA
jgi:hypothetical protein